MTEFRKISDFDRALFELEKIQRQVDNLSGFLISKVKDARDSGPRKKPLSIPEPADPFVQPNSKGRF